MRLNILPPTLRPRQRYVIFEVISKKDFELAEIVGAIWDTAHQLFGEVGVSEFALWIPANLYDKQKRRGLVRCTHSSVEKVRAVLASIRTIANEPVILNVMGVTGTIRSAKKKYFGIVDLREYGE